MKYIVVETKTVENVVVLFDDFLAHDDLIKGIPDFEKIKSVGIVKLELKNGRCCVECDRKIVTPGIYSDQEYDTHLVKACFDRSSFRAQRKRMKLKSK